MHSMSLGAAAFIVHARRTQRRRMGWLTDGYDMRFLYASRRIRANSSS